MIRVLLSDWSSACRKGQRVYSILVATSSFEMHLCDLDLPLVTAMPLIHTTCCSIQRHIKLLVSISYKCRLLTSVSQLGLLQQSLPPLLKTSVCLSTASVNAASNHVASAFLGTLVPFMYLIEDNG